jgi:hypothetical protein
LGHHQIVVVVMKVSQKPLILVAVLLTIPALAQAAPTPDHTHRRAQSAATQQRAASPDRSLAEMDLAPRFYLDRSYALKSNVASAPETPTTALSGQIASDGPVGSVGLINLSGSEALRNRSFGDSLASERGLPSRALGLKVSYNFP